MKPIEEKAREYAISQTCMQYHCDKRHYVTCKNHGGGCEEARKHYQSFLAGHTSCDEETRELNRWRDKNKERPTDFHPVLCRKMEEVEGMNYPRYFVAEYHERKWMEGFASYREVTLLHFDWRPIE